MNWKRENVSETTKPAQCRDEDWNLARDCGLMGATPGTNAWDAALGRFAETIRAARAAQPVNPEMTTAALPASVAGAEGVPQTPAATWLVNGEPDPHSTRYDCERAKLCMGNLTDDELANGAFLNYDRRPSMQDIIDGKGSSPIAWMTAVKDRIRWLSRSLVKAQAADHSRQAQGVDDFDAFAKQQGYNLMTCAELGSIKTHGGIGPATFWSDDTEHAWRGWANRPLRAASLSPVSRAETFQSRVQPWMLECFGAEIAADAKERNHRFLEEALELVQACGATTSEAYQLVDYVYGRPVGEKAQEVGGVMVTLAALCLAQGLDMRAAGEAELARIWTKVEQIRAKQAAKPKHSPLPQHIAEQPGKDKRDAARWRTVESSLRVYVEDVEEGDYKLPSYFSFLSVDEDHDAIAGEHETPAAWADATIAAAAIAKGEGK